MNINRIKKNIKKVEEIVENIDVQDVINRMETDKEKEDWIRAYQEEKDKQFKLLKSSIPVQKENEQLRTEMNSLQKELKQKDKIIEQMTYYIMNLDIDEDICKKVNCDTNSGELDCKDCIKQYFINKAKEI